MAWLPAAEEPCGRRRPPASFSSQYSQLFYFFILDFFSLTLLLPPNTINTNNFFSLALPSPPNTFDELTRKRIWKQNCLVELFGTVLRPEICCGTKMVQFICYYMKYVGLIRFCIRYVVLSWYGMSGNPDPVAVASHPIPTDLRWISFALAAAELPPILSFSPEGRLSWTLWALLWN